MSENSLALDNLRKKLIDISENLYFLPKSSLEILWNAVDEAEMIELLDSANLEEYDSLLSCTPSSIDKKPNSTKHEPKNHGKPWEINEIEELDVMLKRMDKPIEEIAHHFQRSKNSIELKAASLVDKKMSSGMSLERALLFYRGKIDNFVISRYKETKERDLKRKRIF